MSAILYPVAENAEAALHSPRGYAEREREAGRVAASTVEFVTEAAGPAFATREAALDAYAGRIDDERPGRIALALETRWCQLRAVSAAQGGKPRARPPAKPIFRNGRRWPAPKDNAAQATLWRLSVSYWRIMGEAEALESSARQLRRDAAGRDIDGSRLDALARQPLRPAKPQQPLDIGLFEVRLPEAPDIIMPDD